MKDLFLICAVAAVFVFGYFIMKKLDDFLDNNRRQISEDIGTHSLRIAFEMPALIASVADLLDRFSRKNQNCELCLFYGSANEIEKRLSENKLDFGFVAADSVCTSGEEIDSIVLPLRQSVIHSETVGLPVMPIGASEITTKIIWKENNVNPYGKLFAELLNGSFSKKASMS